MATIKQFIQTNPASAMELFGRLLETSDKALKTRERLFGELKDELERAVSLEEQHLFPVLKKHKETKDLVQDAISDNKQTRKLLADLDRTAKDDEAFLTKVSDLRKAFQQHVRDEKKELLPAVLKALSDEEAESVIAGIEDEKAEIEAAKRAEAEERREQAKQEREQVETVQRTSEGMARTVRSMADGAQRASRTAQDGIRTGIASATETAQRSTHNVAQLFSLSTKQSQEAASQAAERMRAVAQSSTAVVQGFQEVSRAWFEMRQNRFQKNVEAFTALSRCRSVPEFVAAQTAVVRENVDMSLENSRRLAQLSAGVVEQVSRTVTAQATKSAA